MFLRGIGPVFEKIARDDGPLNCELGAMWGMFLGTLDPFKNDSVELLGGNSRIFEKIGISGDQGSKKAQLSEGTPSVNRL